MGASEFEKLDVPSRWIKQSSFLLWQRSRATTTEEKRPSKVVVGNA
jgi:hypothetical protein